ncbi:MAG TPA: hypothetical protein DEB71_18715 [Chryseobacterium carnipullorum]|nr:hypothetical protein [Chryseobacterium carnipullorum]
MLNSFEIDFFIRSYNWEEQFLNFAILYSHGNNEAEEIIPSPNQYMIAWMLFSPQIFVFATKLFFYQAKQSISGFLF